MDFGGRTTRTLDWILNGPRVEQQLRFGPDWFWLLKAKLTPGTCSKCYHRYDLHFGTCPKLRRK